MAVQATVKRLLVVEDVWVESEPGRGSKFSFTPPLVA
jgi:signal transduction histidine kinase